MTASVLNQITDTVTTWIGDYGLIAIFVLMAIDAVFPAASEVVMLYAGALASGAIAGQTVSLGDTTFSSGLPAYLAVVTAGTVGYLLGAIGGWAIGARGGRSFLDRHGRWFHLDAAKLDRAEAWFGRWGDLAVLVGRVTPVVRSFISVPAGVFHARFGRYVVLTAIGSAIWCFAFAGAGWAAGASWETLHEDFRYVDYLVVAGVLGALALAVWRVLRRRREQRA